MDEIYLEKKKETLLIERLTYENIEEAMVLRRDVREKLKDKTLFADAVREDFEKTIKDGFGLIGIAGNRLICCLLCILEDVEYAGDLGYKRDKLAKCADYMDVFVHPDYWGNQIQRTLERKMEEICRNSGKDIILGTVAPNNIYSFNNFIKDGYQAVARMDKYGGLDRIIMEKILTYK